MKNREKYREELINLMKIENSEADSNSALCDFVKGRVLPNYTTEDCLNFWCITCNKIFSFWLEEEYEEPEVDWSKVPVDTLVRVRNDENGEWLLRYFCEWNGDTNTGHKYSTFPKGRTSKTATYYIENWRFCDLVEDEDNGK